MSSGEDNETHEETHEEEEEDITEADDNAEDEDEEDEDPTGVEDDDQAEDDAPPSEAKESKLPNSSSETPKRHAEASSPSQETPATTTATTPTTTPGTGDKRKKRKGMPAGLGGSKKGRSPAVRGLTIPFRTVKKAMKLDPDIPIVQNEAAIMTTLASELFLKSLAKESFGNAKARGRNTIRYEDVAEARTKKPALAFLETMLP